MRAYGWVGLLAVMMSACLPKVEQPEVWLAGARLSSIGLSGGVVDVELSVYNPNSFALRASGLTYDLDLEEPSADGWLDFADGHLDRDVEVGAGDTTVVVIPVEFGYADLGRAVRSLLDRGTFDYQVRGVVEVEGPVRRDIRFRHTGNVTSNGVR